MTRRSSALHFSFQQVEQGCRAGRDGQERAPVGFRGLSMGSPLSSAACSTSKPGPGSSRSASSGTPHPGPFTAPSTSRTCAHQYSHISHVQLRYGVETLVGCFRRTKHCSQSLVLAA